MPKPSKPVRSPASPPDLPADILVQFRAWLHQLELGAERAMDSARKVVSIHNVDQTQRQLAYWQDVRRAMRWAQSLLTRSLAARAKREQRTAAER